MTKINFTIGLWIALTIGVLVNVSCNYINPEDPRRMRLSDEGLMDESEEMPQLTIELFAQQFVWRARYTGADGKLGKSNYRLISDTNPLGVDTTDQNSGDDFLSLGELHFPSDVKIKLVLRSKDVLHAAYFPQLRAQMNVVPGMNTQITIKAKMTTEEMRKQTVNPKFDYYLLCNRICGARHFDMKMKLIVDTPDNFLKWCNQASDQGMVLSSITSTN